MTHMLEGANIRLYETNAGRGEDCVEPVGNAQRGDLRSRCTSGHRADPAHPISSSDSTGGGFLDQRFREGDAFERPGSQPMLQFTSADVLRVKVSNYAVASQELRRVTTAQTCANLTPRPGEIR